MRKKLAFLLLSLLMSVGAMAADEPTKYTMVDGANSTDYWLTEQGLLYKVDPNDPTAMDFSGYNTPYISQYNHGLVYILDDDGNPDESVPTWDDTLEDVEVEILTMVNNMPVTQIIASALNGIKNVKTLIIPKYITSIGNTAFAGCSGLKEVYSYNPEPPSLGNNVFGGTYSNLVENVTLYVPYGCENAYKADTPQKNQHGTSYSDYEAQKGWGDYCEYIATKSSDSSTYGPTFTSVVELEEGDTGPTIEGYLNVSPEDNERVPGSLESITLSSSDGSAITLYDEELSINIYTYDKSSNTTGTTVKAILKPAENSAQADGSYILYVYDSSGTTQTPLTDYGDYTFTIPGFAFWIGEESAGIGNAALIHYFTIEDATEYTITIDPENNYQTESSISTFTVTCSSGLSLLNEPGQYYKIPVYKDKVETDNYILHVVAEGEGETKNSYEFTFNDALSSKGTYTFTLPAGMFTVGPYNQLSENIDITYTLTSNAAEYSEIVWEPNGESVLTQLYEIYLYNYIDEDGTRTNSRIKFAEDGESQVTITDEEGKSYTFTTQTNDAGTYIEFILDEAITTGGKYTISIPAGAVLLGQNATPSEDEISNTYQVASYDIYFDPVDDSAVEKIETFTVMCDEGLVPNQNDDNVYDNISISTVVEGLTQLTDYYAVLNTTGQIYDTTDPTKQIGQTYTIYQKTTDKDDNETSEVATITEPGTYQFEIGRGLFALGEEGVSNGATTCTYHISTFEIKYDDATISVADDNSSVTATITADEGVNLAIAEDNTEKIRVIKDASTLVAYATAEEGTDGAWTFTFISTTEDVEEGITLSAGDYTLTIPEGFFTNKNSKGSKSEKLDIPFSIAISTDFELSLDPDPSEPVNELSQIIVTAADGGAVKVTEGNEDNAIPITSNGEEVAQIYYDEASGNKLEGFHVYDFDDNDLIITTPGEYTFTIPQGYLIDEQGYYNAEKTVTYTIEEGPIVSEGDIVWVFNEGTEGQTATIKDEIADDITSNEVTLGSTLSYNGTDEVTCNQENSDLYGKTVVFTKIKASVSETDGSSPDETNAVDFTLTVDDGKVLTPSSISLYATRFGTDNGSIDIAWIANGDTIPLMTGVTPNRASDSGKTDFSYYEIAADAIAKIPASAGTCKLRVYIYGKINDKSYGLANICINGDVKDQETFDLTVETGRYAENTHSIEVTFTAEEELSVVAEDKDITVTATEGGTTSTAKAVQSTASNWYIQFEKNLDEGEYTITIPQGLFTTASGKASKVVEETYTRTAATAISSTGDIVWAFDLGTDDQTATISEDASEGIASGAVTLGTNLSYHGSETVVSNNEKSDVNGMSATFTTVSPATQQDSEATENNNVDFTITLENGYKFTPTSISLYGVKCGTSGGNIDITWIDSDGKETKLATKETLERDINNVKDAEGHNIFTESDFSYFEFSETDLSAIAASLGTCTLRVNIYGIANDKQIGLSNIAISGTLIAPNEVEIEITEPTTSDLSDDGSSITLTITAKDEEDQDIELQVADDAELIKITIPAEDDDEDVLVAYATAEKDEDTGNWVLTFIDKDDEEKPATITEPGTYTITIPEGYFTNEEGTIVSAEATAEFTIVEEIAIKIDTDEAVLSEDGKSITVAITDEEGEDIELQVAEDSGKMITITTGEGDDLKTVVYATAEQDEETGEWTLSFVDEDGEEKAITNPGTYTITIPEGYFTNEEGTIVSAEATATFTIESTPLYETDFTSWSTIDRTQANGKTVTVDTETGGNLTFTFYGVGVDPTKTDAEKFPDYTGAMIIAKYSADGGEGIEYTNCVPYAITSPLGSLDKLTFTEGATASGRGVKVSVRGTLEDGTVDEDWVTLYDTTLSGYTADVVIDDINRTNCQIKFESLVLNQNAYIFDLKIYGTDADAITATWDWVNNKPEGIQDVHFENYEDNPRTGYVDSGIEGVELYVDASNGKLKGRADNNDAQFNQGTIIYVPVSSLGDVVTVTNKPNYYGYTIGGNQAIDGTNTYSPTAEEVETGWVAIESTLEQSGQNTVYLQSISVTLYQFTASTDPFTLEVEDEVVADDDESITITFDKIDLTVAEDLGDKQITVTTGEGDELTVVAYATVSIHSGICTFTFISADTENEGEVIALGIGTYSINIPTGYFVDAEGAEAEGMDISFTIEPQPIAIEIDTENSELSDDGTSITVAITATDEEGEEIKLEVPEDSDKMITITTPATEEGDADVLVAYATAEQNTDTGEWTLSFYGEDGGSVAITEPGEYTITIPQGYFTTEDGAENAEATATFTIEEETETIDIVIDTDDAVLSDDGTSITVAITDEDGEAVALEVVTDSGKKITITTPAAEEGADDVLVAYATAEQNTDTGEWVLSFYGEDGESVEITAAGTYTITIPEGYFTTEEGAENAEATGTFTIEKEETEPIAIVIDTDDAVLSDDGTSITVAITDEDGEVVALEVVTDSGKKITITIAAEEGEEDVLVAYATAEQNTDTGEWILSFVDAEDGVTPVAITTAGTYTITIPEGYFTTEDGAENAEATGVFTIDEEDDLYETLCEEIDALETNLKDTWSTIETEYPEAAKDASIIAQKEAIESEISELQDAVDASNEAGTLAADAEEYEAQITAIQTEIESLLAAATGINSITIDNFEGKSIYTISGQKVSTPTKSGIYIIDGKKVVIK